MLSPLRLVSEAVELAARRHNGMARKGRGKEPYVNHLAEVANLLATATSGVDAELVAAGWLHDTIEDTETTRDELAQKFSERVASLVQECTDDMNLPKAERRRLQVVNAPHKSPGAKLIKIADKISNIGARIHPDPSGEELHCDFIFVGEDLAPRVRAIRVDQQTQASDHQPVVLTLS